MKTDHPKLNDLNGVEIPQNLQEDIRLLRATSVFLSNVLKVI